MVKWSCVCPLKANNHQQLQQLTPYKEDSLHSIEWICQYKTGFRSWFRHFYMDEREIEYWVSPIKKCLKRGTIPGVIWGNIFWYMCIVRSRSSTSYLLMHMEQWASNYTTVSPCYFKINTCKTAELESHGGPPKCIVRTQSSLYPCTNHNNKYTNLGWL